MEAAIIATEKREKALSEKGTLLLKPCFQQDGILICSLRQKRTVILSGVFIFTPFININRVDSRVANGGHSVPTDKIESRYRKAIALIPELIPVCDSINIWDNSTDKPYRIFRKKPDSVDYFDNPVWNKSSVSELTGILL